MGRNLKSWAWGHHLWNYRPERLLSSASVIQSGFSFYKILRIRNGCTHLLNRTALAREESFRRSTAHGSGRSFAQAFGSTKSFCKTHSIGTVLWQCINRSGWHSRGSLRSLRVFTLRPLREIPYTLYPIPYTLFKKFCRIPQKSINSFTKSVSHEPYTYRCSMLACLDCSISQLPK